MKAFTAILLAAGLSLGGCGKSEKQEPSAGQDDSTETAQAGDDKAGDDKAGDDKPDSTGDEAGGDEAGGDEAGGNDEQPVVTEEDFEEEAATEVTADNLEDELKKIEDELKDEDES